jgi:hypothetical protein
MPSVCSVAARLLGRVLVCSPGVVLAGAGFIGVSGMVVQEAAAQEWQFAGWYEEGRTSYYEYSYVPGGTSPISARDLRMYTEVLGLDDMQTEIMRDAYTVFDRAYRIEWVTFSEARSDAQHSSGYDTGWSEAEEEESELEKLQKSFDEKVERMEDQFIGDLRLVLTGAQLAKWELLEREQRRAKTLAKYAAHEDEKVDLVACVQALELSAEVRSALEPLLEQYREQMDVALVARNRKAETVGKRCVEVDSEEIDWSAVDHENEEAVQAAYDLYNQTRQKLVPLGLDLHRACERVREVNEQFIRRIEEALPADQVEAFRKIAVPKAADDGYGGMYAGYSRARMMLGMLEHLEMYIASTQMQADMWGESGGEEMAMYLKRMREVQPLTKAQREQIAQIKADWEAGTESIRAQYASSVEPVADDGELYYLHLPTPSGTLMLHREYEGEEEEWDESDEDPTYEMQQKLSEEDQRAIDRLRQILTIEQRTLFATM